MSPQERILRWRAEGPALFAAEALGAQPTPQQWEASKALAASRRVSIRSGHGTGKTAFMAWTVLWAVACFAHVKVPCTAPTASQLSDILWAEIATWHRRMPPELRAEFRWTAERFERADAPAEAFATARTSRKENPEALQGFHAPVVVFLIDEASGVPEEVFQVAEGALSTEGAYVLMCANPTQMLGYFYDSHHKMRARWTCLHWNAEDSPLVSREWVADMAMKYGVDSAIYRIRVRGDFAGNPDGVISLALIEGAIGREVKPFGVEVWGVDVARFGADRTTLAKRRGNALLQKVQAWTGKDTMQVAGLIKLEYEHATVKPVRINVDVIGIGAGVVDRCREMKLPVVGINVAEAPSITDKYERLRDELWFAGREWFERRDCRIVDDEDLVAELTLPTYKFTSSGKIKVESKDELKKRGVVSPDVADAFLLTFALQGAQATSTVWKPLNYDNRGIV